jgi:hypothetical protein
MFSPWTNTRTQAQSADHGPLAHTGVVDGCARIEREYMVDKASFR